MSVALFKLTASDGILIRTLLMCSSQTSAPQPTALLRGFYWNLNSAFSKRTYHKYTACRVLVTCWSKTAAGNAGTDDPTSQTIGESPQWKLSQTKEQASSDRFSDRCSSVDLNINMNFQIVVALACCLLDISKDEFDMHQFTHMLGHKVVVG